MDAAVRGEMERLGMPGMAVGILRGDDVETRAWGVGSLRTGDALHADAVFRVASISKVFTATLVMILVDDGLLDLDTPVSHYLPDLRLTEAGTQDIVTLRMLLSHGSGQLGDFFVDHGLGEDASQKAIEQFHKLRLLTAPGESWAYCNSGFHLAGRVMEVVTGQHFDALMRERVFEPLGLTSSGFWAHEMLVQPLAVGHDPVLPDSTEHAVANQYYPRSRFPSGGVFSNAADLLRFAAFHMGDGTANGQRVLREASLHAMQEPQRAAACWADAWGIGWDIRWVDGTKILGHGGSINGYRTQLVVVPKRRFALALMTNSGRGATANVVVENWLLEHELGLRFPERPPVVLDDAALARFTGSYRQDTTEVEVAIHDGGLRLEMFGPWGDEPRIAYPTLTTFPIGEREFQVVGGDDDLLRLDFLLHDDGTPRYLRMHGRLYDRVNSNA